jgi:hypothetical protein
MATLTISAAARLCHCDRRSLQRAIHAGRLHLDAQHCLSREELMATGYLIVETPQDAPHSTPQETPQQTPQGTPWGTPQGTPHRTRQAARASVTGHAAGDTTGRVTARRVPPVRPDQERPGALVSAWP